MEAAFGHGLSQTGPTGLSWTAKAWRSFTGTSFFQVGDMQSAEAALAMQRCLVLKGPTPLEYRV